MAHSLAVSKTLADRIFSCAESELAAYMELPRAQEFLAGRFAVKEAVLKALSEPLEGRIALGDISTLKRADGSPELVLSGTALRAALLRDLSEWQVSISHDRGLSIAMVVAL